MIGMAKWALAIAFAVVMVTNVLPQSSFAASAFQSQEQTAAGATVRRIGAVKAINGTSITLTPDSGSEVIVTVRPATRMLRITPGEKDLKNAAPIQLQDVQVGDRILVGGQLADDKQSLLASSLVLMKRSDLQARSQQELQDWQKRGVDGLAKTVDPAAGTITISARNKTILIHVSNSTAIRRYAPDSVKFDDARPSTLAEVHSGDQVRARGDRSADGAELNAEEVVSGSFRNIAGTVDAIDATASTVTIHDLLSKKNVQVKITPDSQLRKLSPEIAQRIAVRLKGAAAGTSSTTASSNAETSQRPGGGGNSAAGGASGWRTGGTPDFQQMLNRVPALQLSELHKGDAVIVVATEGTAGSGTAITLMSGVEPILRAAPNASSYALLTPWTLGAPSGDTGGP
jgi:hypothetical protein